MINNDHDQLAHPISDDPKTPLLPLHGDPPQRKLSFRSSLSSIFTLNNLYLLLGPLLSTVVCLFVKLDGPVTSTNMLAILVWVFAWWLTEAVPVPVTSMSPLFLFPLFGISSADHVAHSYMDDVIALVLGSFILVLAVEHYNIHRRLAFNVSSYLTSIFFSHFFIYLLSQKPTSILIVGKLWFCIQGPCSNWFLDVEYALVSLGNMVFK